MSILTNIIYTLLLLLVYIALFLLLILGILMIISSTIEFIITRTSLRKLKICQYILIFNRLSLIKKLLYFFNNKYIDILIKRKKAYRINNFFIYNVSTNTIKQVVNREGLKEIKDKSPIAKLFIMTKFDFNIILDLLHQYGKVSFYTNEKIIKSVTRKLINTGYELNGNNPIEIYSNNIKVCSIVSKKHAPSNQITEKLDIMDTSTLKKELKNNRKALINTLAQDLELNTYEIIGNKKEEA